MPHRDPYTALGVLQGAAITEIKAAYRRRARALHPDVNANDPDAEEKFKELVAAYELLCDPLRRAAYDRDGAHGSSWDFAATRTSYARRAQQTRRAPPQVWSTLHVVQLKERTGLPRRRSAHVAPLHRVVVSPDVLRLATHRGDAVHLWNPRTGRSVARLASEPERVRWLGFSPDGQWLVTDGARGTVIWDATSGRLVDRLNLEGPQGVRFSSDGRRMATAVNTLAQVSDVVSGQELARIPHEASVRGIALSRDGHRLATAAHKSARVWDLVSGQELAELAHEKPVTSVELSPDGHLLASSSTVARSSWTPSVIHLWDVAGGDELARLQHNCWVDQVAFSPDGKRLATDSNGTLHLWDLSMGRQLMRTNTLVNSELVFSPDGRWLSAASRSNVYVWDVDSGYQLARLNHAAEVLSVAVSPDGQRIGTGGYDRSDQSSVMSHVWHRAESRPAVERP